MADSPGPLWVEKQFETDGDADDSGTGAAGAMFLTEPRNLKVPLGSIRNGELFAVHVSLDANDVVVLNDVIKGDTVREVLDYVEYDISAMMAKLRSDVETAGRSGRFDVEETGRLVRFFEDHLHGYTYLEESR